MNPVENHASPDDLEAELEAELVASGITAEPWDEDHTPYRKLLYLDASTYKVQPLFDLPACNHRSFDRCLTSPGKNFAYRNFILPRHHPLRGFPGTIVLFNGEVVIPSLIDLNREAGTGNSLRGLPDEYRAKRGACWMSITPMEMLTQRSGVGFAEGTVVIGGLGPGWLLRKVCEKPAVNRVIVVERSRDLLEWYGYALCSRYPKVTDVICDDVYEQIGKHGNAKYLLDIWPTLEGARFDPECRAARWRLKEKLWAWGID